MENTAEKYQANVTMPQPTECHLDIEIPRERFTGLFKSKVKKYSKELNLKGFRKGTVPKRLVEERFSEPITNETLEKLVEQVLQEVCVENKIKPIASKVEDLKNENGQPIQVKAVVEIDQEMEFINYTGLGISIAEPEPVTDATINEQVMAYCKDMAKEEKTEEPGRAGDMVVVKYEEVTIDGKAWNLAGRDDFKVEIGADKIMEFNQAFTGCKAGEIKEINVEYPKDYTQAELAGRKGYYRVKIVEVLKKEIPEPTDHLARQLGSKDLDDLKGRIRQNEEEYRKTQCRDNAEREVILKIMENHPFDIPRARIKHYIEYRQAQLGMKDRQLPEADYTALEAEAIFNLRRFRIIAEISRKEKIKATQEEVDARITAMAGQYNMEFDTLKASLRKSGRINNIREEIKSQKTMDFLLGSG